MNSVMNFLLHFVFIVTFIFLFVVSIVILRPFRIHRHRPRSTIALKLSYLLYLAIFLLLSYLVLFFLGPPPEPNETNSDPYFNVYYVIMIIAFLIPNIAIMFRRKIKSFRLAYNYLVTGLNIIIALSLVYVIYRMPWEF